MRDWGKCISWAGRVVREAGFGAAGGGRPSRRGPGLFVGPWLVLAALAAWAGEETRVPALRPVVEAEEEVYSHGDPKNGSGPMWCHGSTCLVRVGDQLFASGVEVLPNAKPLNNCRWLLFRRGPAGWEQVQADPAGRTREPCPLAAFATGPVFLSANPTLVADPATYSGPARPEILSFSPAEPKGNPERLLPDWAGSPPFTEHSYRSFAADGVTRQLILFQNVGYTHAEWSFRDAEGRWSAKGQLKWPWGAEYDKPQPVRVCYPNVALKGRAVHFCGVSDIVEPYEKWRAFKKQLTGREWDYDFRRLFYTWTADITTGKFADWVEVSSRDRTCGWVSPGDLWVAPDGAAHIVWTERALDERLREKFFPTEKQSHSLNYAVVRQGQVASRKTLMLAEEGGSREVPSLARLQVTPENRLFVFFYVSGADAAGKAVSENRVLELHPDGSSSAAVRVPLAYPLGSYFTATVRAGSPPSQTLDLLGPRAGAEGKISYARVKLY